MPAIVVKRFDSKNAVKITLTTTMYMALVKNNPKSVCIGCIIATIPKINEAFTMLDPIRFPIAISECLVNME